MMEQHSAQIKEKNLNQYIKDSEPLSFVLDQIVRISKADVYVYDSRQKQCFIYGSGSADSERCIAMRAKKTWPETLSRGHVHWFIDASGIMMAAVRIEIDGECEGSLAVAPFKAELTALKEIMKDRQDFQISYLLESEAVDRSQDREPVMLFLTGLHSILCLLESGKRCIESMISCERMQIRTELAKNRCSVIGLRYQNMKSLSEQIRKVDWPDTQMPDLVDIVFRKKQKDDPQMALTESDRMEQAFRRILTKSSRFQGQMWCVRNEQKLVEDCLIFERQQMNGLFEVKLSVAEESAKSMIPFGILRTLVEYSVQNSVSTGKYKKEVSISVSRDREFCKIVYTDNCLVLTESYLERLRNLRPEMDFLTELEAWYREGMPELDRILLNMSAVFRKDFTMDIESNEISGTRMQMKYRFKS